MSLPGISVKRPVTALMLMLVVIMLGAVSYSRLSLDLLPKINPPVAAIITSFQGASPQEVMDLVTVPLEAAAATVPGTKEITSISQEGMSAIIMMFDWGQNMAEAREDISQRIDMVPLPEGVGEPMVVEFDPTLLPIMQVSLSAPEGMDLGGLTELVRRTIKSRLEGINGVASVDLLGAVTRQITVKLDPAKLNAYHLTQDAVSAVISASNLNYPLGTVEEDGLVLGLRFSGKFTAIDDLKSLVIGYAPIQSLGRGVQPQVRPVKLSDVASVEEEAVQASSITRINGKPSVTMTVQKEGTANTVVVARAIRQELDKISSELGGLSIVISMDQAQFIEDTIRSVADNLLMGAGLAVLVLLLFLRDIRSTLVIAISIPFSVIATFVLMYFGKLTLNIMTMGGLALGVGMLVDNSIVVIENIYQHVEKGESPVQAAISGAEEVGMAITASTLTTVVVFLPVAFVGGVSGILFKELALTVTFSLMASLVVALTVVPMLASKFFASMKHRKDPGTMVGPALRRKHRSRQSGYTALLNWCLAHRAFFLAAVFVGVAGSVYLLLPRIETEFLPTADEGGFAINVSMKEGTPLDRIDQVVKEIEKVLDSDMLVASYSVVVGEPEGLVKLRSFFSGATDAQIIVRLVDQAAKEKATRTVMERIQKEVEEIADGTTVTFNPQSSLLMMSGSAPGTVEVLISGPDIREVEKLNEDFLVKMAALPGMKNVRSSLTARKPEMMVVVDRDRAMQHGLTPAQVALSVSRAVRGQAVSRFEKTQREGSGVTTFDVVVRFDPKAVKDVSSLKGIVLAGKTGPVKLRDIATIVEGEGPVVISRSDQKLSARLTGQFADRSLGAVTADLMDLISETDLPEGYSISIGGMSQIMEEGFSGLRFALYLAVLLVYMIMAASFESLGTPFIIFFTMPLAAVGVLAALYLSGYSFGITAFIGVIVLAGVVVNNGIVLVDFMRQRRRAGIPLREAVLEGASRRVRPVLMTSLTTILGLIPMALGLGQGGELGAPMALVTMGGLGSSTLFTLFVIPVLYSVFTGLNAGRGRRTLPEVSTMEKSAPDLIPEGTAGHLAGHLERGVESATQGTTEAEKKSEIRGAQDMRYSERQEGAGDKYELGVEFTSKDMAELIELLGKLFGSVRRRC